MDDNIRSMPGRNDPEGPVEYRDLIEVTPDLVREDASLSDGRSISFYWFKERPAGE